MYSEPHRRIWKEETSSPFRGERVADGQLASQDSPGHRLPRRWRDLDTVSCSLLPNWRE